MSPARVSDATGRLQLRRALTRRQRLQRAGLAAVVATTVLALAWLVGFSEVLAVRSVTVTGTKVLTEAEVRAVADVPAGRPLIWVDPAGVAERVAALAPVARVSVVRQWPDRIAVAVTERQPRFVVESGTGYLVVDGEGVPYQALLAVPKGLLVAQADADDPALLTDIGTVLTALDSGLRHRVRRVTAPTRDAITLELENGIDLIWGSAEQSALKLQVATELMRLRKASRYDVSAPSNPTTR